MKIEEVKRICDFGTGVMGPGITLAFALAGYQVFNIIRNNKRKIYY